MFKLKHSWLLLLFMGFFIISCGDDMEEEMEEMEEMEEDDGIIDPGDTANDEAVLAFINVEDGGTIEFAEGTFTINQALIMSDKSNVIIKGQGASKTILNFSGQTSGGESIKISDGSGITLCGFTVLNGVSDAIKTQNIEGIRFTDLATNWEGDVLENNGNYGIYPVLCNNVEVVGCYTRGSADAGIYVGQSTNIVVKDNLVEENVAGIEIENCIGADVHDNTIQKNSGGILVYDLGNITSIRNGRQCRIYNNDINNNNHRNFSPNPNSLIGRLPVGTGIILLATDSVEVFNNTLTSNNLASIAMASYEFTGEEYDPATGYNPRLRYVDIHDNVITRDPTFPDNLNQAGFEVWFLVSQFSDDIPEIVYDGIPGLGTIDDQHFRMTNNGDVNFVNFNLQADASGMSPMPMDINLFAGHDPITLDAITVSGLTDCN